MAVPLLTPALKSWLLQEYQRGRTTRDLAAEAGISQATVARYLRTVTTMRRPWHYAKTDRQRESARDSMKEFWAGEPVHPRLGKENDTDHRSKIAQGQRGNQRSEETRRKQSEAARRMWAERKQP